MLIFHDSTKDLEELSNDHIRKKNMAAVINTLTWVYIKCCIINAIWDKSIVVSIRTLSINKNSIWHPKIFSSIKGLPQSLYSKRYHYQTLNVQS